MIASCGIRLDTGWEECEHARGKETEDSEVEHTTRSTYGGGRSAIQQDSVLVRGLVPILWATIPDPIPFGFRRLPFHCSTCFSLVSRFLCFSVSLGLFFSFSSGSLLFFYSMLACSSSTVSYIIGIDPSCRSILSRFFFSSSPSLPPTNLNLSSLSHSNPSGQIPIP